MSNLEKYIVIFTKLFEIDEATARELHYQDIEAWDSVGHMSLISEIEEVFGVDMEVDDIINFESFEVGMKILAEKYSIQF